MEYHPEDDDKTQSFTALTSGTKVGHYTVIEKIGAGGMGEVYLAEDESLKRKVALKFLPSQLNNDQKCRARFSREAQAAAQLSHPNIVTIFEVSEFEGRPYFAMEYIAGKSLRNEIEKETLTAERAVDLVVQLCEGLKKAHDSGIIHRDIKPTNIAIDLDGRPKLLDFGLAAVEGAETLTKVGSTLGTIGYMSPEQIQGKELDQRSDLFSLGAVLYEMIAGKPAFAGSNTGATLNAILNADPAPLSEHRDDVPESLQVVVKKALVKDLNERYQSARDMLDDLTRLKLGEKVKAEHGTPLKFAKKAALPGVVLILAVLMFVLQPWNVKIERSQPVEAAQGLLAVITFSNVQDMSDSSRTAQMTTGLLITDLAESRYLRVVNRHRLLDVIESMGMEDNKSFSLAEATEIAQKTNARWMLTGKVMQTEPNIILASDVTEAASGKKIADQTIIGGEGEDLFSVVDKLTTQVKQDLGIPESDEGQDDLAVADVTTHSPQAYRHYLEGVDFMRKFYFPEARRSFLKALQYDSTFAMAYYQLSANPTLSLSPKDMIDKAISYSESCGRIERHLIMGRQALWEGRISNALDEFKEVLRLDPDSKGVLVSIGAILRGEMSKLSESVEYFERAIQLDPNYGRAYNHLSYVYGELGDLDTAIQLNNRYIELSPGEANPYDTRGEIYAMNGDLESAIEAYEKALEIKPDFISSHIQLGHLHLFKRDYDEAERHYRAVATGESKADRALARIMLAYVPAFQGRFAEAIRILDAAIVADELEEYDGINYFEKFFVKSTLQFEQRDWEGTHETMKTVMGLHDLVHARDDVGVRDFYPYMLANSGDTVWARQIAEGLKEDFLDTELRRVYAYWEAIGSIELTVGDIDKAVEYLEKATEYTDIHSFHLEFILSEAYLKAGKFDLAIARLEKTLRTYEFNMAFHAPLAVRARYMLGLAYEGNGLYGKAIEAYEEFLDIWKDADPGIESVEDAKKRLAGLRSSSS